MRLLRYFFPIQGSLPCEPYAYYWGLDISLVVTYLGVLVLEGKITEETEGGGNSVVEKVNYPLSRVGISDILAIDIGGQIETEEYGIYRYEDEPDLIRIFIARQSGESVRIIFSRSKLHELDTKIARESI